MHIFVYIALNLLLNNLCLVYLWTSVCAVDGTYCRVSDNQLYITFSNALGDTLRSGPMKLTSMLTQDLVTTIKWGTPYRRTYVVTGGVSANILQQHQDKLKGAAKRQPPKEEAHFLCSESAGKEAEQCDMTCVYDANLFTWGAPITWWLQKANLRPQQSRCRR